MTKTIRGKVFELVKIDREQFASSCSGCALDFDPDRCGDFESDDCMEHVDMVWKEVSNV
jgi:hypothetical protein